MATGLSATENVQLVPFEQLFGRSVIYLQCERYSNKVFMKYSFARYNRLLCKSMRFVYRRCLLNQNRRIDGKNTNSS